MVASLKDEDFLPPRPCHCCCYSHHICLRAGICEPDEFYCRLEPLANQLGKLLLVYIVPTKTPSLVECLIDRTTDSGVIVAIYTSRKLPEEINVGVAVQRGECAAIARGKRQGEWVGMEDCTGITPWEVFAG